MNVLVHCMYFVPEVGGLESHVFHLGRAMVEMGHAVVVITSRSLPSLPRREVVEGIEVYRSWFPARNVPGWAAYTLFTIPLTCRLARRAQILHAQDFPSVLPLAFAQRVRDVPLVATLHTSHFLVRAKKARWKPILRALVRAPDHLFAASREIALVAEKLAPGVRAEPLANGVETALFRPVPPAMPASGRQRLVVPRRLFPKNGVEFLLHALPRIVQEVDVEVVVVGDGPERQKLERMAVELGIGERVSFLGKRPHADMPALLCSGDLVVIPSLMEATSVAALEAMACGVPVAASRVGGLPEIVDEGVGGLFKPGNSEDLAEVVIRLLRGGDLPLRGRRGRERVEARWSNRRLVERHLQVYGDLLERGVRGAGGAGLSGGGARRLPRTGIEEGDSQEARDGAGGSG